MSCEMYLENAVTTHCCKLYEYTVSPLFIRETKTCEYIGIKEACVRRLDNASVFFCSTNACMTAFRSISWKSNSLKCNYECPTVGSSSL